MEKCIGVGQGFRRCSARQLLFPGLVPKSTGATRQRLASPAAETLRIPSQGLCNRAGHVLQSPPNFFFLCVGAAALARWRSRARQVSLCSSKCFFEFVSPSWQIFRREAKQCSLFLGWAMPCSPNAVLGIFLTLQPHGAAKVARRIVDGLLCVHVYRMSFSPTADTPARRLRRLKEGPALQLQPW